MPLYKAFRWVQHIQNLTLPHKISIKISYIFWCLILGLIFWDFGATWCQKARFWEPIGAQLGPKWRPKSPKWRQNGRLKTLPRRSWNRPASKTAFGTLLGTTLVDFGIDFLWFSMEFSVIFIQFSINFWRPSCTPLKPHALTILAAQSADSCPQRR